VGGRLSCILPRTLWTWFIHVHSQLSTRLKLLTELSRKREMTMSDARRIDQGIVSPEKSMLVIVHTPLGECQVTAH
jgi:hypothetical protein